MEGENSPAGYQEIVHTADWALRVWAASLPELFRQAALGMYFLLEAAPTGDGERHTLILTLTAVDAESLLVSFLSELLYICENDNLAFDQFEIAITHGELEAKLTGGRLESMRPEIKAVTYHDLNILKSQAGYETTIVFDV